MIKVATGDNLFRPVKPSSQSKFETTDSTARAITKAEADRREARTRSLRQARLEMEARRPAASPTKRRAAKKQ